MSQYQRKLLVAQGELRATIGRYAGRMTSMALKAYFLRRHTPKCCGVTPELRPGHLWFNGAFAIICGIETTNKKGFYGRVA